MYVHVLAWPYKANHLDGFAGKVEYAQLLNDASEVQMIEPPADKPTHEMHAKQTLTLTLPIEKPDVTVPVIELFLR
jgi:alpha-L-fucosidase